MARDQLGQFTSPGHSRPDVALVAPDVEGLRATLEDFLHGSLPGFGFEVPAGNVEAAVDHLVGQLTGSAGA